LFPEAFEVDRFILLLKIAFMTEDTGKRELLQDLLERLTPRSVVTLRSKDKDGALRELVSRAVKLHSGLNRRDLLQAVREREELLSTAIGGGVAMPHVHAELGAQNYLVVLGRSTKGIAYFTGTGEPVLTYLIVLVISDPTDERTHLRVLSALATILKDESVRNKIRRARSAEAVVRVLRSVCEERGLAQPMTPVTQATLTHAISIAHEVEAETLLIYASALRRPSVLYGINWRKRIIFASHTTWQSAQEAVQAKPRFTFVQIPPVSLTRMGQIRMGLLFSLSRGLLKENDVVVCVAGPTGSDVLDTIVTVDVSDRFGRFLPTGKRERKGDVEPEVLERVVAVACTLAIEGREGKPLGTTFIVGDSKNVAAHVKQLVINPFRGYAEEHLNILDPSMEETIREFAALDGAFLIRGDGVLLSAGTYLAPPAVEVDVPPGLGARHTSACALTAVTNAYAVVVSQTAGTVTVFRKGKIFVVIERPERPHGVLASA